MGNNIDCVAKELLEKTNALNFEKSEAKTNIHNLFSILKMETKEVSAHSAFIYHLLNKDNFDGDDSNLREFIRLVLNPEIYTSYSTVEVKREYCLDEESRIDFVVFIDGKPFAIEMKVWAGEQKNQLERYSKIEPNKANPVYFLTPIKKESKTYDKAILLGYKEDLFPWLDHIKKNAEEKYLVDICFMLKQYKDLINKLTSEYEEDKKIMELITKGADFLAVDRLIKARRLFAAKLMQALFNEFDSLELDNAELLKSKYTEKARKNYYDSSRKFYPATAFVVKLDEKEKEKLGIKQEDDLLFYIEVEYNLYCGFSLRTKKEESEEQYEKYTVMGDFEKEYAKASILNKIVCKDKINACTKNMPVWLIWEYLESDNGKKINFKDFDEGFQSLIIPNTSQTINLTLINELACLNLEAVEKMKQKVVAFYNKVMQLLLPEKQN